MAAEALENAGSQMDVEIYVETKGSAGISAIDDAIIATADAAIFAADIGVRGRDRFEHLPIYEVGVKVAINQPFEVINEAIERAKTRVEKQTEILETSDRQSHLSEKSASLSLIHI